MFDLMNESESAFILNDEPGYVSMNHFQTNCGAGGVGASPVSSQLVTISRITGDRGRDR